MPRWPAFILHALLVVLLAPAAADAATVRLSEVHIPDNDETFDREDDSQRYSVLRFTAAPGERNRLVVKLTPRSDEILFRDTGARLKPGRGCRARTRSTVVCREGSDLQFIRIALGGRGDRLTVSSRVRGVVVVADGGPGPDRLAGGGGSNQLDGGSGSDRVTGGRRSDLLEGGPGADRVFGRSGDDEIHGGTGADRLYGGSGADVLVATDSAAAGTRDRLDGGTGTDRASYFGRREGVTATVRGGGLPGERDVFRSIEGLIGGSGADTLTGDDRANRLEGGTGADRVDGRGGDDRIDVDYSVLAEDSLDITCGDGSDRVAVYYTYAEHVLIRSDCERLRTLDDDLGPDPRPEPVTPADTVRLSLFCAASYVADKDRAVTLRTPKFTRPWFSGPVFEEIAAEGTIPRGPAGDRCPTTFTLTQRGRELLASLGTVPVTVPAQSLGAYTVLLSRA